MLQPDDGAGLAVDERVVLDRHARPRAASVRPYAPAAGAGERLAHDVARGDDGRVRARLREEDAGLGGRVRGEGRIAIEVVLGHVEEQRDVRTEARRALELEARDLDHDDPARTGGRRA